MCVLIDQSRSFDIVPSESGFALSGMGLRAWSSGPLPPFPSSCTSSPPVPTPLEYPAQPHKSLQTARNIIKPYSTPNQNFSWQLNIDYEEVRVSGFGSDLRSSQLLRQGRDAASIRDRHFTCSHRCVSLKCGAVQSRKHQ